MLQTRPPIPAPRIVGNSGVAVVLLLLFLLLLGGMWLYKGKPMPDLSGDLLRKKEKEPSAAGVEFSTEAEPVEAQAKRYYREKKRDQH